MSDFKLDILNRLPVFEPEPWRTQWQENLEKVRAFREEHNRLPNRESKDPEAKRLGTWCITQKRARAKGKMSPVRIKALNSIKGWQWEGLDKRWQEMLEKVRAFRRRQNRFPVQHSKDVEESKLAIWCVNQKMGYKKRLLRITPERIKSLESIQDWWWEKDFDTQWKDAFEQVLVFWKRHSRFPSKVAKTSKEAKLGRWCSTQRGEHKGGEMTLARVKALNSILGWQWGSEGRWQELFNQLKAFRKKYGRFPPHGSKDAEEKRLGSWCSSQKQAKKGKSRGKMTPERIKALESIKGWQW